MRSALPVSLCGVFPDDDLKGRAAIRAASLLFAAGAL